MRPPDKGDKALQLREADPAGLVWHQEGDGGVANGRCPQLLSCCLLTEEERAGPHPAILSCPGVCKGQPCSAQPQREGAVKRPRGPQPACGDATPPQTAESKVLPRGPQPGGTCSRGALRTGHQEGGPENLGLMFQGRGRMGVAEAGGGLGPRSGEGRAPDAQGGEVLDSLWPHGETPSVPGLAEDQPRADLDPAPLTGEVWLWDSVRVCVLPGLHLQLPVRSWGASARLWALHPMPGLAEGLHGEAHNPGRPAAAAGPGWGPGCGSRLASDQTAGHPALQEMLESRVEPGVSPQLYSMF